MESVKRPRVELMSGLSDPISDRIQNTRAGGVIG
jgi:hypothetical protein